MYIVERSMFPYMLRITPCCLRHNEFARKDGHRESASTAVLVIGRRYREVMDVAVNLLASCVRCLI